MANDIELMHYALAKASAENRQCRARLKELNNLVEGILMIIQEDEEYAELAKNAWADLGRIMSQKE
jgi:hypothetical protein